MAGTVGIVSFFVALIVVIVIHEAAHFGTAKWFRIKVEEFFVGFGPRIWSFRRGETEYGLKAIPAGGYVKIAGMNPFQPPAEEDLPRTFGAKPIWQRALVIFAGPATHFVLAFLCLVLWVGFVGMWDTRSPLVAAVATSLDGGPSPAHEAGLRAGDRIVAVDGTLDPTDLYVVRYTRQHVGEQVAFTIERDGTRFSVTMMPVPSVLEGKRVGRIGVMLVQARVNAGPIGSITEGFRLVGRFLADVASNMARLFGPEGIGGVVTLLFTDAPRKVTDPVSVLGIGRAVGQTAQAGNAGDLLALFAYMNLFIGLLNLLPLPPFDGGHLAVLAVEKVRGRPVDMRKVVPISVAVAAYFVLLTISIMYLDIVKPINLSP